MRLRGVSNGVVGALSRIEEAIATMRDHVISAAIAVEEQSAVTQEMSSDRQGAAHAVTCISGNIGGISSAVGKVSQPVQMTNEAEANLQNSTKVARVQAVRILIPQLL